MCDKKNWNIAVIICCLLERKCSSLIFSCCFIVSCTKMPSLLPFMCIWRLLYSSLSIFFFKFGGQKGWIIPDILKDSTVHYCLDYADSLVFYDCMYI